MAAQIVRSQVAALILAAGEGTRLGGLPKGFLQLNDDSTLIELAVMAVAPFCSEIVVATRAQDLVKAEATLARLKIDGVVKVVAGGSTRQETVTLLVNAATNPFVLLHEVSRPFVTAALFANVIQAAAETGAASLYLPLPVRDSVALMANGMLGEPLPRSQVVALQTPHAYRREVLADASRRAADEAWVETGTAALVKRAGYNVKLVLGSPENLKITYPEDWELALKKMSTQS